MPQQLPWERNMQAAARSGAPRPVAGAQVPPPAPAPAPDAPAYEEVPIDV